MKQKAKVYFCPECGYKGFVQMGKIRLAKGIYDCTFKRVWRCKNCGFAVKWEALYEGHKILEKLKKIEGEFGKNPKNYKSLLRIANKVGIEL